MKNSDFDKLWGNQPDSDEFDRLWTGVDSYTPKVVNNPSPYPQNTTPVPVNTPTPQPTTVTPQPTTYAISRDGFAMDEDLIAEYGTYDNYLKSHPLNEFQFKTDDAGSGTNLKTKYGTYENYQDNVVTDDYYKQVENTANTKLAWGYDPNRQTVEAAKTELKSLTSLSQAAAAKGMTIEQYQKWQQDKNYVDDLAKKAEEAFVPVQVAAQDLERLQGEIDALLAPNYGAGNIDLSATPRFDNGDGTYSTVDSISFHDDKTGLEILIPTVIQTENGWEHVSAAQAIEQYRKTGNYLGAFRTVEEANTYANQLHEQQEDLFARWSELSAQYQAAAEMYRNLNDEFQNGIYAGLQAANDNYLIAYDPTQYYLNNGIDYAGIMDTIGALDAYISTLPAGSDRYITEQRRRDSLYAHRMAFATDDELKDIYADYGYKSSYEADPEEYAKRADELAELNARKRELDGLKAIGANIDETEYEQLVKDIEQAESNGPKSSKNKELRDAAGMEIARRDAEKILDQIMKQTNTDAVQYLDLLATYATSGVIPADRLVELGIPWQAVQAYTPDQLANVTKSALVKAGIDKQAAANTVETVLREGNAKATSMMIDDYAKLAESGAPGRIAATVLSFGSNVYSGLGMLEGIRAATNGSTIKFADPNSAYFGAANMTNALRSGVTDAVDWKVGQVDLFDTAYGILTSSVDSMLAAYMGGPVGGTLIGTQAAAQAMLETTQNGGSLSEAVTTGVVAGIFESLFETISIGQFRALQENDIAAGSVKELLSKNAVGEFSKNLLKSFFVNASEEMATEAANIIFDYMKSTPSSNYVRAIAEVKTQINPDADTKRLYTDEEAKAKVAKDLAWQVVEAGITGGLQGILMGSVAQLGAFKTVKELRSLVHISSEQAGIVHTICVGETYSPSSNSFKTAQMLSQKLKAAIGEGKAAVTQFFQENQQAFAELEQSVADEMKDYAPDNYTPEVYKAAKESVVKGDATPPHIETPTETRIRDVQTAVGMTEEEAKATQSLLYSLVNGNGKLDTDAAQKAKLLNSDAFKRAVYELTGMQVEGSSNSEIRHSLNEIARQIRESDTVDLNPVDVPMQAQDNLVPAENPGNFSFLSSVMSKLGQESQNAADTTVAPTTNDQLGTAVAEGPVTGAYGGGGGNELLSYVMGNLTRNDQTGAGLADMQAPVQQQMGEPAPAQTVEPVAPAQPAQPAQTVTPREGKTRFSVADNITDTGTRPITKEQHLTEQILNTMLSGSGLQVKVVSGDPSLTGATGRYSNGVLYVNGDLRSANTFNGIAWVVGHEMVHAVEERTGTGEGGAVNKIMSAMQALAKEGVLSEEWLKVATDKDAMNALEDEYRNTYRTFLTNKYMREGYSPNDALVKANNEVEGEAGLTYVRGEIAADFMGSILGYRAAKEKTGYGSPNVNRMDALLKLANVDRGLVQDAASSVMDMRDKLGSGAQAREERGALNNLLLDIGQALYFSKDENEDSGTRFSAAELEDMSFADQIELACQGKIRKKDAMRIGRTRGILRELGLTSDDQHMTQGKFFLSTYGTEGELAPVEGYGDTKENSNIHMVTYDTMEHLPKLLEDPVMVYLSRHDDGSEIIVVTEDVDKEGFPVLAVINPDGYAYVGGEKLPSNFVESVYGAFSFVESYQSDQKYSTLQTIVREGLLMWADEEKSRNLIQRYRDRFSVSRTSDNRGNQRDNSDPLSGFVFNQIIQKWNPEVKSFDRDHNVMQPIRNSDTGRTYGNANEFVEDAKAEAANQNLRYDGYVIRLDSKGDKYTAYALDRNGKTVELYHGVGLEEITAEKRADKPVLNGGGNAEIRVFSPNERSSVSVFTSDYKTENDGRALLIESSKTDGRDRRSDYALQRELERAAREGYDLLLWADANAQMNVANPYSTQDKDGQVTGQKSLTNIYDKGFSDYYGKYGEVETFYLPDAKQSVAPERYLELQSERATLMQQLDEARKQATEGQQADAEAQLRARQLQNKLIDVNAEMSEIRNKDEKVEQKGAAVPGIRITDEIRNQFSERYSVAGENSAIADLDALDRAIKYSKRKKDANWIYDRTGWWFDPNDGKWRFEIADNEARFIRTADESRALKDPQYAALRSEYRELSQKNRRGNLTQAERARLDEIGPQYLGQRTKLQSDFRRNGGKLEDVLQHDTLFQSYPELRDYTVVFSDLPDDTYGTTSPGGKVIEINKRLKNDPEFRRRAVESKGLSDTSIDTAVMSTLLHEVQHAIQRIEGFAEGYNDERAKTAQDAAQNLFDEAKNEYAVTLSNPENWELPNAVIQKVSELAKNNVNVISVTDPYTGVLYTNFGDQGMESRPAPKDRVEKGKMMWNLVNAYLYDLFEQKVISYEDYEALTGDELDTLIDAALDADYAFRMNGRTIDAFDLYQATHGEQEARQTAERMRMTPEERRQNRIIPPTEAETRDAKKLDKLPEKLTGRMMADDDEIEWERARYSAADDTELDNEYTRAVEEDDPEKQYLLVKEAAKRKGFKPMRLFHGTKSFGFTQFDLKKMDDKRSIFLVDDPRVSRTYSGVSGVRNISGSVDRIDTNTAPIKDVLSFLNKDLESRPNMQFVKLSDEDLARAAESKITHYRDRVDSRLWRVGNSIDDVRGFYMSPSTIVERMKDEDFIPFDVDENYKDTIETFLEKARDLFSFGGGVPSDISQMNVIWAKENLDYAVQWLKYKVGETQAEEIIRLSELNLEGLQNDLDALQEALSYEINTPMYYREIAPNTFLTEDQVRYLAKDLQEQQANSGNYEVYAKFEKPFVVDANGERWNRLRLTDAQTNEIRKWNRQHPDDPLNYVDNAWGRGMHFDTRDIAEIAQKLGYDSVQFKNVVDDGGKGLLRAPEANVFIVFNPNDVKSADNITVDDNGNVIPLSERFNTGVNELRYSVAEEGEQVAQEQPNLLTDVVQRMQAQSPAQSRFSAADAMDYEDWVQTKAPNDRQPISQEQINNTQNNRASREAVNIPRTGTKDGYVTDRNVQTIINSGITTDEAANAAKQALANGAYQHMEYHDEAALDKATKKIEYDGWAETLGQYRKDVMAGKASKDITAMGIALYNNAVTSGHIYDAMDIASLMIKNASSVGAALQATRMLNRLTPEGRLYMAVRSLENIANELRDLYGDQYHYDVDNALLDQYRNALIDGDEKAAKEAWKAIEQQVADQIPSDWKLKLNNWRYLAMLGNPRTHIRNIVGNLGFMPVQRAKQGLKAVLERMKMGQIGEGSNRTTAILNPFSSEDKALRKAAKDDYVNSVDLIQSGGKMSSTKGDIENLRTVYKSKFLEWLRKKNSELLDKEDTWFSRPAYAQALASFLKARGVSAADFTSGKVDANLLNEAREHAILEAQRATYRDTNEFSAWVSSLGKAGKRADAGKWQKAVSLATEAVLPFKKTPANILVRAVEYSPAEFAKVFFGDIKQVRAAQAETKKAEAESDGSEEALQKIASLKQQESSMVSDMLDHISSGLTGTALLGLGALLRHMKIISGGKDPDDEQAAFDDLHGQQEYSINLGGINYTIDWLAPEALPMFTGVTLYDRIKEMRSGEDRESDILSDIWDLVTGLGEPMLNMSMLSSVNDLVSKMSYLDDATQLPALLGQIGYGYISQYIPTLFGQVERITEAQRESTYYDRDDKLSKDLQYMLGKTANKIPVWDYNQIPYLDAWGQEQDSGNLLRRVFANMFSPGYIRERTTSDLDNELQRMHDLGYSKMLPERTTQSTKVDQEYMNEQEYVAYARLRGQTALADLTALTESKAYQNMTDEQKAKAISKIYSEARSLAEDEVRKMRGEKVKGTSAEKAGMNSATFSAAKTVYETANAPSWYNVTDENGEQKVPNWSKMLTVLNDNSFSKADRLKFVNGVSTRKEDFKTFDEAKTYYTEAEEDAKLDIKYSSAKDVYDNAKTPDGYKTTETGNTPVWAKMLALLDSKSVSDTIKLEYINRVSGRKEPYASLGEARSYYEDSKKKAKK